MTSSPAELTIRVERRDSGASSPHRLQVPDRLNLAELHEVLREKVGWREDHEYEFRVLGQPYRSRDVDARGHPGSRHPCRFTLSAFGLRAEETFGYEHGTGEDRRLRLTVEEVERSRERGADRGPDGSVSGTTVELELEPEAEEALAEVFRALDEETAGPDALPPPVQGAVEELLIIQAEFRPDRFSRALKPETWAAGAVHAAHLELGGRRAPAGATLWDLAEQFEVSPGSVSRRSRELRETAEEHWFVPGPADERFLRRLEAELRGDREEGEPGAGDAFHEAALGAGTGEAAEADDPVGAVETLLLSAEHSGFQAPY